MNQIVSFRLCKLTDKELLEKVDTQTDKLFDVKHKHQREGVLTRHIPAKPNEDYDLLIGELLLRFKEKDKQLLADFYKWVYTIEAGVINEVDEDIINSRVDEFLNK